MKYQRDKAHASRNLRSVAVAEVAETKGCEGRNVLQRHRPLIRLQPAGSSEIGELMHAEFRDNGFGHFTGGGGPAGCCCGGGGGGNEGD